MDHGTRRRRRRRIVNWHGTFAYLIKECASLLLFIGISHTKKLCGIMTIAFIDGHFFIPILIHIETIFYVWYNVSLCYWMRLWQCECLSVCTCVFVFAAPCTINVRRCFQLRTLLKIITLRFSFRRETAQNVMSIRCYYCSVIALLLHKTKTHQQF